MRNEINEKRENKLDYETYNVNIEFSLEASFVEQKNFKPKLLCNATKKSLLTTNILQSILITAIFIVDIIHNHL